MDKNEKRMKAQLWRPCATEDQLDAWLSLFLGIRVPRSAVCAGHCAPFDYMRRAYFEPATDLVVWAPRGGGKTRLAAAATLLDLLHKPGAAVRILGGSLEQSLRLWEHLLPDVMRLAERSLETRAGASRHVALDNGASAAVLTQSQRAVRGLRVQKLRCDEIDLFDPQVWEAAQLATKSKVLSDERRAMSRTRKRKSPLIAQHSSLSTVVAGAIEAISTYHKPWGMMSRVTEQANARGTPVLRWCLLEVLQRCPQERDCAACPLWNDCRGVAKTRCDGFVSIDDAIRMMGRVSRDTWEAEMLCQRPSVLGSVFPRFNVETHVRESDAPAGGLSLAMDFGFANPFVCLWIVTDEADRTFVIDEYVQPSRPMHEHIAQIQSRRQKWGDAARIACDPAGNARNEQTALSNVNLLRQAGYTVRFRQSLIVDGIEMIRCALNPSLGEPKLFIHPRCKRLIKAMQSYRYADGGSEVPLKDGEHDHLIDALRYHYVNRPRGEGERRRY